jgi:signal transduction histidine kinase
VWHAARIVQTLRTFSRGSQPELVPQDLAQVIGDALFLMGNQLERWKNVKLSTEFEPGLPKVLCDRNQIAQVLINLLTNACDAMPDGGAITLRLARSPAGAVIEVTDEGMGIDADKVEKIFDPFYTTKDIGKGSGLGLSIVDGIVRAHNGTVSVQSVGPGPGATFTVTLPFAA